MAIIAFDISQTGKNKAGCGYFAHSISQALTAEKSQYEFILLPNFGDSYFDRQLNEEIADRKSYDNYGPLFHNYDDTKNFWCSGELQNKICDFSIIHSNNFWCPINLIKTKLVYTLYDLSFMDNPNWTTEQNRLICLDGVFKASLYADYIIAISEFTKQNFLKKFSFFPRDRISVVYPSGRYENHEISCIRPEIAPSVVTRGFWLSVGTIEPRKNQKLIVEAYYAYSQTVQCPMPLVFVGGTGWLMENFKESVSHNLVRGEIIFTGYLTDSELRWLYSNCYANLYVSHYEGFGLPVLEGLQCGAPTICSNNTSLPEVGGGGVLYLSSDSHEELSTIMLNLTSDKDNYSQLKNQSTKRAESFKVSDSMNAVLDVYNNVTCLKKRNSI